MWWGHSIYDSLCGRCGGSGIDDYSGLGGGGIGVYSSLGSGDRRSYGGNDTGCSVGVMLCMSINELVVVPPGMVVLGADAAMMTPVEVPACAPITPIPRGAGWGLHLWVGQVGG